MNAKELTIKLRLEKLYKKYPEHKDWIYGTLVPEIVKSDSLAWVGDIWTKRSAHLVQESSELMSFWSSNGKVGLDDLREILTLEGFETGTISGRYRGTLTIMVRQ